MAKAYVMVVEDNVDSMWIVTEMLNKNNRVLYCNVRPTGRDFFAFMEKDSVPPINLILLDLNLPGESGFSILQKVRAHPKLRQAVVVAMSADNRSEQLAKVQSAGFDGFIGKPLQQKRFTHQLQQIMEGQSVWETNEAPSWMSG
jgi:two-component system cell cycle response regulator DivK